MNEDFGMYMVPLLDKTTKQDGRPIRSYVSLVCSGLDYCDLFDLFVRGRRAMRFARMRRRSPAPRHAHTDNTKGLMELRDASPGRLARGRE